MPHETRKEGTRKQAVQERSRAMVDAILDGALRAFMSAAGDVYEPDADSKSPSVNHIAEIAGVSIGSLYQYFPGKRAIVAALVRRRMRQIHERLLVILSESSELSLEETAAKLVDCTLQMKAASTAIDDTILREAIRHALTAEAFALDTELVQRFGEVIERFKPRVRSDLDSSIAAHLLFQGLRAVMVIGAVARPELTHDPRLRSEMEALIIRYLRPD